MPATATCPPERQKRPPLHALLVTAAATTLVRNCASGTWLYCRGSSRAARATVRSPTRSWRRRRLGDAVGVSEGNVRRAAAKK
ncbi:hypothetical protein FGB62_291g010 [Gracilaria domingensis]|nr:hypothetical protein FGB62_291g010 [Gracilaria domingensis]